MPKRSPAAQSRRVALGQIITTPSPEHRPPWPDPRVAPVSGSDSTASRFDRRASSYEDSTLQQYLFIPVQQTTLRLALQLLPQPRRILDVGCGTGRLLRQRTTLLPDRRAGRCRSGGADGGDRLRGRPPPSWRSVTSMPEPSACPSPTSVFDLVFTTLSLRHWTNQAAGIAEVARVLTPSGVVVLADIFRSCRHRGPALHMLRRRRHTVVPAELGAVLAAHRLEVIGCEPTRWFGLPDVQVLAVQQPHRASAKLPTQQRPSRAAR